MEELLSDLVVYAPYVSIPTLIFLVVFSFRRARAIQAAERIVKTQYEPASKDQMDGLIAYGESINKRDRILSIFFKMRSTLGHDGIKVGHIAWALHILESSTPLDEITVPRFNP